LVKAKPDNQAEIAILEAARKVFTHRGYAGARMESKEKLFDLVFAQRAREFFLGMVGIVNSPATLEEKIRAIVAHDIDMMRSQPDLPLFIMQELAQNPDRLVRMASESGASPNVLMKGFKSTVKEAVDKKQIRPVDGGQLLINIISLCVYPFIAKPMIKAVQEMDDKQFERMIINRKKEVVEFVMNALKP